jgi:hypothetical protein
LKRKLGVDFRKYRILGACNPPFAYQALQAEDKIGLMLPCTVILQELENRKVEVAIIDPVASMQAVEDPKLIVYLQNKFSISSYICFPVQVFHTHQPRQLDVGGFFSDAFRDGAVQGKLGAREPPVPVICCQLRMWPTE